MAAPEPQVQENQQLTDLDDYQLSGDNSTVERKRSFLDQYRTHGVIYRAAQATGIHRTTVYKWLESDTEFVRAFDDCHQDTYDNLEASGFQKAMNGDPILTMFYLKAHRPKFRDKVSVDLDGVQEQIDAMMSKFGLTPRQLQPVSTEFIDTGYSESAQEYSTTTPSITPSTTQFSHLPQDQQKED